MQCLELKFGNLYKLKPVDIITSKYRKNCFVLYRPITKKIGNFTITNNLLYVTNDVILSLSGIEHYIEEEDIFMYLTAVSTETALHHIFLYKQHYCSMVQTNYLIQPTISYSYFFNQFMQIN